MTTQAQPSPWRRPSRLALAVYQRRSDMAIRNEFARRVGRQTDWAPIENSAAEEVEGAHFV
jgi:hypothetical protein